MNNEIQERLSTVYQITGTNANSLAKLIDVPRGTMYNLDSGKTSNPTMEFLVNLEKYAGISMRWFSTGLGSIKVEADTQDESDSIKEQNELLKQTIQIQKDRIKELEFISQLYRNEKMKDKAFANFKGLVIEKSPVYLDVNVVEFKPAPMVKVIPLHAEGYTGGDEVVQAS